MALLLAGALLLAERPAHAAAADSLSAPSVQVVGGRVRRGAATAHADSVRARTWHQQPRFVMARSLLVPGWGQLHNHAWLKAVFVAAGEVRLGTRIMGDQRELDRLLGELDLARETFDQARELQLVNEYNGRLNQRLGRQWLLGGVLAYALVDAYVDAHFRGFDLEFQTDPALPAGTSPPSPTSGGDGPGFRLALRWDF